MGNLILGFSYDAVQNKQYNIIQYMQVQGQYNTCKERVDIFCPKPQTYKGFKIGDPEIL